MHLIKMWLTFGLKMNPMVKRRTPSGAVLMKLSMSEGMAPGSVLICSPPTLMKLGGWALGSERIRRRKKLTLPQN
mgnify:CR=1 FL=1